MGSWRDWHEGGFRRTEQSSISGQCGHAPQYVTLTNGPPLRAKSLAPLLRPGQGTLGGVADVALGGGGAGLLEVAVNRHGLGLLAAARRLSARAGDVAWP